MRSYRALTLFVMIACTTLSFSPVLYGQATTGSLAGTVIVKADGTALPGVTVEAIHQPTGTRYDAVTGSTGRYVMPNVRVGGPYLITANLEGFQAATLNNIQVGLGTTTEAPISLQLAGVSESITITAQADEIINPNRTGSTSTVSETQIETLPTVNRSLQDFARTNPYFRVDAQDFSSTRINVAGRNNRYNQIQIDGAVNNDLFGLADTGTPGGQTDAQPISIDAISQLQLVVSPYDVRQGGFTGGGINAVTRSGTNKLEGSIFGSQRKPSLVGDGPTDRPISDFEQEQYGARLGGPIMRDKLFFFLNGEINRKTAPTGAAADNSAPTQFNRTGFDAARLRQFLLDTYQYDPGGLGDFGAATDSDNFFARADWNLNNSNQITLRHNYVDAIRDVFGGRSSTRYTFETATYQQADTTNSTVAQINTVFGASAFNEGRVGFQTIKDERAIPVIFPSIEIGGASQNASLTAGTERFSGANALDQDVLEITDDFTWIRGGHTIIIGTHNEFFKFKNTFLSDFYGAYFFPTQADFEAGRATEYRISFATGSDPKRPTEFEAGQYGLYVNDQWRMTPSLTLTFGIRADKPTFPDKPAFNQVVVNAIGLSTGETASESVIVSPRVGFNWNPSARGNQQLRGGIGVFAGRAPYVWISNAYAGTGVFSASLTCLASANCAVPAFNPDPNAQPRNLGSAGTLTVDLIDPDFKFPRILRGTLGYDRDLFWGVRGTIEAVVSKSQEDVFYVNANLQPAGTSPLDGRPTFARVSTALSDAYLLTNTSEGQETTATLQLNRPFTNGLIMGASYAWQNAESAFDATSSRAVSNWRFRHTAGDVFEDDISRSAFEVEHRFNVNMSYSFDTGPLAHNVGLFYNSQSGRPYSILMNSSGSSVNGDFNNANDLLFVPSSATALILCPAGTSPNANGPCGGTATAPTAALPYSLLADFLSSVGVDPTAGRILDRYEQSEPWSRLLDLHYEVGVDLFGVRTSAQLDVSNVLNMIDKENGRVDFVANQNITVVNYRGIDTASGKPVYALQSATSLNPGSQFSLADTRSRWQARVGLRVTF